MPLFPAPKTKIEDKAGMKIITIFYSGPVESWDELFREAADRFGYDVNDASIRFTAVPRADI